MRKRSLWTLAAALLVAVALPAKDTSTVNQVSRFTSAMEKRGFTVTEGAMQRFDLFTLCCEGKLPSTAANNASSLYLSVVLDVPPGSKPPDLPWFYRLRSDEAVVLLGKTPPPVRYFSQQTFLAERGENGVLTALGDTINMGTVRTIGEDVFNNPVIYIITANQKTAAAVRSAVISAGYPESIINVEPIASALAHVDLSAQGDALQTVHRFFLPVNENDLQSYIDNPPFAVFRVTPKVPLPASPYPVPELRVHGTGHTEMNLWPLVQKLEATLLQMYGKAPWTPTPLATAVWRDPANVVWPPAAVEKPYVAIQQQPMTTLGASRDTNYLRTYPDIVLKDNDFLIVYGVNHQRTGKVTYSNFTVYADDIRLFGTDSVSSPEFGDARSLLPDEHEAVLLYAWEVAHQGMCHTGLPCLEVKQLPQYRGCVEYGTGNPWPLILDTANLWVGFRSYVEPATKVAPDDNELIYDRVIYFAHQ